MEVDDRRNRNPGHRSGNARHTGGSVRAVPWRWAMMQDVASFVSTWLQAAAFFMFAVSLKLIEHLVLSTLMIALLIVAGIVLAVWMINAAVYDAAC
jgi:hypothetical protein